MKIIFSIILSVFAFGAFVFSPTLYATSSAANSEVISKNQQQDEEILAFLIVINNNEIAAAHAVAEKSVPASVSTYASLMKKDHSKNLRDTLKISKSNNLPPQNNAKILALKEKGKNELASLTHLNNVDFAKAYIAAMVNDHDEVLTMIDNDYLKQVTNPQLKDHLIATREHVVRHLQLAKEIQPTLNAS